MLYNSALLLTLISVVAALLQNPPPPAEPPKNLTRSSGIVGTLPRIFAGPEDGRPLLNGGSLVPMVGAIVSDRMRDRHNCGIRPDLGFGGFFNPLDSYPLLIGDGKVLNGTQGQELVTKGCKTMTPEGPKKLYVPLKIGFILSLDSD
ncbi:hypothetical protein L873DRAFT_1807915 [Choiromyces venosus 120613-1]|uniref:Uncharacterized protein n=1 Tax=Choiromyces venosus 120613-1 TaxID=1336337 RepID=A0A3N4JK11_9PEZI|nr:hypothetical protein L873DRAFT_1807915 [Choiromyces venosus 120613-1]